MGFLLNWLFWRRAARKQEEKNAKIFKELGENKAIMELAERDPELKKNLRVLGVKTGNDNKP